METNVLYYGDNLDILRKYIPDNSIDLIYLDPPFNSKKDYNILFKENDAQWSPAQIKAFEDTWHWDTKAEATYQDIITKAPMNLASLVSAMRGGIGANDVTAYLVMMAARLAELHRVLKPTGSLYLHCDPTTSHYIKIIMDPIFGADKYLNEITWQRTGAHSDAKRWGRVADIILFYSKGKTYTWNPQFIEYADEYVKERYKYVDDVSGRLYWRNTMTAAGPGPARYFRGTLMEPPPGTHWRFSQEEIRRMDAAGKIYYSPSGMPYVKSFLDERRGKSVQCIWTDIVMSKSGKERLDYPTQKPLALLERMIKASSNEGDIVLDPFCGCGTALVAAHKLNREWVGIDITHLAIAVMKRRLQDHFPGIQVKVIGEPVDLPSSKELAKQDRYQFQWWALSLIGARPLGEKKKGADKGIDGLIPFPDDGGTKLKRVVVQVKSGHVGVKDIRELKSVAGNDPIGILLTLETPTQPMKSEAAQAGFYESPLWQRAFPRIQILTIEEIFSGKRPDIPMPAAMPKAEPIHKGKQPKLV